MDSLLLATVGFARLLLGGLFLANLGAWLVRYSGTGQVGVILALGAMGAAWLAQTRYHYSVNPDLDDAEAAEQMRMGHIARWLCVVLAALSFVCIIFGP